MADLLPVAAGKLPRTARLSELLNTSFAWVAIFAGLVFLVGVVLIFDTTDVPHIRHMPSVPGLPILGSLAQLGSEQPRRLAELSKKYGPVFQIRLGNKRFVVANSFDSVRQLWVGNQSSLISRPTLHTFHNVLSSSQGFTIGTSPWDESCKRRRKAAATALNRPSVASYMPFVDLESYASIKELVDHIGGGEGQVDLDPYPLFQRLALNLSLTLGYGFRIGGSVDNNLLREIITVERSISTLRSTSNNWQDFVPLLRIFSTRSNHASELRHRRDVYLEYLLQRLKEKIANGSDVSCITGNILQDPECKLNHAEIKSICVTMIAGGLDTTPACMLLGTAILSGPQGASLQKKLLDEIDRIYPDGDAWGKCLVEEKCAYMMAFCKEVLRFWTVIPMSLPRVSIKDVVYQGATIPAGTTFLMNAWAADHDADHFQAPEEFRPERFLDLAEGSGTQHFAFGAGSRMCTGSHLAYREMYVTFIRMLVALEVLPAEDPAQRPVLTGPLECNANPTGLSIEPKPFKIGFRVRDWGRLREWFAQTVEATSHIEQ
ncbi:phenylacetate 2-hydroxylase [Cladophialophora yegresii CBS 114405]|uniref:Phenylacetate 2-hydroxylase n=1 Tax=Cladophialophora yegresii CBS 114405 TaxID=1182544 RepID=W9WDV7_9EURO|nr:phenylacetate 2-hydroxylase [Cladophialophora yegresii CBS 114405]EXJ63180.1 phenylacetate 2-hydroxylase [Cladophialophora yegresii CBS 114405]